MEGMRFKGDEELVHRVDAAVQAGSKEETTEQIANTLCEMIRSGELQMPEEVLQPVEGHYARRLMYRSPEHGYSMVAMTWGPEQGTPIHDHAGLWCVESVCHGAIKVVQYELQEDEGDRCRFSEEDRIQAGIGTAGCLIPPHEYHTIRNNCGEQAAVTLHIYGGDMQCCNVFEPLGDGWYKKIEKSLCFDKAS